jgi:hypothetical protein
MEDPTTLVMEEVIQEPEAAASLKREHPEEPQDEAAENEEGDEVAAENDDTQDPPAKRAKMEPVEPVKLGPKTFKSGEEMFLYFANLLREVTVNQNMNEVCTSSSGV